MQFIPTKSVFIPAQFIVQLENAAQPSQWGGGPLISGFNVLVADDGSFAKDQVAHMQRLASSSDFTDELLAAINAKLLLIGLTVSKIGGEDAAANPA